MRIASALLLLLVGSLAHAASFSVTHTHDDGPGSLRNAIVAANAHADTSHIISFDASFPENGVILLTRPLPVWNNGALLIGGGNRQPVIDGNHAHAIFDAGHQATQLWLAHLTIRNGLREEVTGSADYRGGACVRLPQGVAANLALHNTHFSGCTVQHSSVVVGGGAVYWEPGPNSSIVILDSSFIDNHVVLTGGTDEGYATGGAAALGSKVTIERTVFSGNVIHRNGPASQHGQGGALFIRLVEAADVRIADTQFSHNKVTFETESLFSSYAAGGAVSIDCRNECNVRLIRTSFFSNALHGGNGLDTYHHGGAFSLSGKENARDARLIVENSSFMYNQSSGHGGALSAHNAKLDMRHSAFLSNMVSGGPGHHVRLDNVDVDRWAYSIIGSGSNATPCVLYDITLGVLTGNVFENDCGQLSATGAVIAPAGNFTLDTTHWPMMLVPAADSPAVDIQGDETHALPTDAHGTSRPQDGDGDGVARADAGPVERVSTGLFADGFED